MVFLVFVHGYNLNDRYLQPWTTPNEALTVTTFIEYLLANGLLRFRIPLLFIVSGYLYALHDELPNKKRVGKRMQTLLVPYLLWSAIALVLFYLLELSEIGKRILIDSHLAQIDDTRLLVHDYAWYEILARWIFFPVAYQLWFIRVLLVYNLAYPFIRWCVTTRNARTVFFMLVTLFWLSTTGFVLIEGEGLLFFALGVWIQKANFNIETPRSFFNPKVWAFLFIGLALSKTVLAFYGVVWLGDAVFPVLLILHKATVFSGLVTCWFGLDGLVRSCMRQSWFVWLTSFSFIIYALHVPLVAILINPMFEILHYMEGYRMITFFLLPLIIIIFCIGIGIVLRSFLPKVYSLLTGGRGI